MTSAVGNNNNIASTYSPRAATAEARDRRLQRSHELVHELIDGDEQRELQHELHAAGRCRHVTFRDSEFNHTSTAIVTKSMQIFDGSIRNATCEHLCLHNVHTESAQMLLPRNAKFRSGAAMAMARERPTYTSGNSYMRRPGVYEVEGIMIQNTSGDGVQLASYNLWIFKINIHRI